MALNQGGNNPMIDRIWAVVLLMGSMFTCCEIITN